MNIILGLHGNPGSPDDYDLLKPLLQRNGNVEFLAAPRPAGGAAIEDVVRELAGLIRARAPERLVVMGFSWGAYLACQLCNLQGIHPDGIILINPFLVDPTPLPRWMRGALGIPVLRSWLLGLAARKREGFVEKMFLPGQPEPELRVAIVSRLSDRGVWAGALRYKEEQDRKQLKVLSPGICGRLVVIRGERDAIADWPIQRRALAAFESSGAMSVHVIPGAGHSLLWTHGADVGQILNEEIREVF